MTEDFRGPAARKFDWEHIFERHSALGVVARQSGKKTVFIGSESQIKARVRSAWRKRVRISSQFDPLGVVESIQYRGTITRPHQVIEFWYNVKTRVVETAYPARDEPL